MYAVAGPRHSTAETGKIPRYRFFRFYYLNGTGRAEEEDDLVKILGQELIRSSMSRGAGRAEGASAAVCICVWVGACSPGGSCGTRQWVAKDRDCFHARFKGPPRWRIGRSSASATRDVRYVSSYASMVMLKPACTHAHLHAEQGSRSSWRGACGSCVGKCRCMLQPKQLSPDAVIRLATYLAEHARLVYAYPLQVGVDRCDRPYGHGSCGTHSTRTSLRAGDAFSHDIS